MKNKIIVSTGNFWDGKNPLNNLEAIKKIRPSITKEVEKAYEELGEKFSSAKGKQMKDEMPSYFG